MAPTLTPRRSRRAWCAGRACAPAAGSGPRSAGGRRTRAECSGAPGEGAANSGTAGSSRSPCFPWWARPTAGGAGKGQPRSWRPGPHAGETLGAGGGQAGLSWLRGGGDRRRHANRAAACAGGRVTLLSALPRFQTPRCLPIASSHETQEGDTRGAGPGVLCGAPGGSATNGLCPPRRAPPLTARNSAGASRLGTRWG